MYIISWFVAWTNILAYKLAFITNNITMCLHWPFRHSSEVPVCSFEFGTYSILSLTHFLSPRVPASTYPIWFLWRTYPHLFPISLIFLWLDPNPEWPNIYVWSEGRIIVAKPNVFGSKLIHGEGAGRFFPIAATQLKPCLDPNPLPTPIPHSPFPRLPHRSS